MQANEVMLIGALALFAAFAYGLVHALALDAAFARLFAQH